MVKKYSGNRKGANTCPGSWLNSKSGSPIATMSAMGSGKVAGEEILKWSKEKVIDLIFEQGFSTAERAGIISGRGVGMDIVKKKIEEVHGTITVDSEEGKFSQFTINIPVNGR